MNNLRVVQNIRPGHEARPTSQIADHPNYSLVLFFLITPLAFYLYFIGKWSLSGDEYYSLKDSSQPIWHILQSQVKPIYYVICHFTLQLPVSTEWALRLPAAVAASLIAPVFYLMLRRRNETIAIFCAVVTMVHPWIFEIAQYGRFYSLMLLFASISLLSLFRWIDDPRKTRIIVFVLSGVLATLTHTTAFALLPAGLLAIIVLRFRNGSSVGDSTFSLAWKVALILLVCCAIIAIPVYQTIIAWLDTQQFNFGDYSAFGLIAATAVFSGIQMWALAFMPLLKTRPKWSDDEVFLCVCFLSMFVPFVLMAPFGRGVAPRYLIATLPPLILLAAVHWRAITESITSRLHIAALGAALIAAFIPYGASTMVDGNHDDFRRAAQFLESLKMEHPIIASSTHGMLSYYLDQGPLAEVQVFELGRFSSMNGGKTGEGSFAGRTMNRLSRVANETGRPLVLVSDEDRNQIDARALRWIGERFAIVGIIEKTRFDHRQNRLVIYRYQPASSGDGSGDNTRISQSP